MTLVDKRINFTYFIYIYIFIYLFIYLLCMHVYVNNEKGGKINNNM